MSEDSAKWIVDAFTVAFWAIGAVGLLIAMFGAIVLATNSLNPTTRTIFVFPDGARPIAHIQHVTYLCLGQDGVYFRCDAEIRQIGLNDE